MENYVGGLDVVCLCYIRNEMLNYWSICVPNLSKIHARVSYAIFLFVRKNYRYSNTIIIASIKRKQQ